MGSTLEKILQDSAQSVHSKMLFSLLLPLSSSLSISFSPSKTDAKPLLGVVYESLCPYSRQFIREQVHPAYTTLSEFFDVEFIAYGGASTHGNAEDGYTLLSARPKGMCREHCAGLHGPSCYG